MIYIPLIKHYPLGMKIFVGSPLSPVYDELMPSKDIL